MAIFFSYPRSSVKKKIESCWPWICGLMVWCVYESSNTSGLYWGDSGEFLSASNTLGIGHPYGHPLFWLIGRIVILFDTGNPAAAMNHLTALFSAATCIIVGLFVKNRTAPHLHITQKLAVVFTVTGIYAFATTVWTQATFVEVYNFQAFFLALAIYLFDVSISKNGTSRHLYAAVYFWGISITLGLYAGFALLLPAAMWIQNRRGMSIRQIHGLPMTVFLALGLSIWIYLPVRSIARPVYFFQNIDSLKTLFDYLSRSYYAGWTVPGIAAVPLTLSKMAVLLLRNLGVWGCLIFGLGFWSSYSRREKSSAMPYLLVCCVFILVFSIFIPLNMTFRQMDGMDVYYIPVLLMAVPVLASGANRAASFMKRQLAILLALPVLFLIGFRWPGIAISGDNNFETFRKYLIETTPEHAVIISAVDEIAYAYYYSVFAQSNPKDFHLVDPKTVEANKSLFKQYGLRAASFFDLHSPFLVHVDDFEDVRIAGPFFVFKKDSVMAHQFEQEFQRRFSFQEKNIASMHLLDRQNFALIWAKRGIFWIYVSNAGPADSQYAKKAFQTGCSYLEKACAFDDFSYMGASHAANLALISIQAGNREHVEDLARRALRINPFAVNAQKALSLLHSMEKDV